MPNTVVEPLTDSGVLWQTQDSQASSFRSHRKALAMLHLSAQPTFPCTERQTCFVNTVKTFDNVSIYSVWDVTIFLSSFFSTEAVSEIALSLSRMPTQGL